MTCHELAAALVKLQPDLPTVEVARLCLLILNQVDDPETLRDEAELRRQWGRASFRLDAATDQHAAMADELESLCQDGPIAFSADQIWLLLRAVKVNSQVLELYTGEPSVV